MKNFEVPPRNLGAPQKSAMNPTEISKDGAAPRIYFFKKLGAHWGAIEPWIGIVTKQMPPLAYSQGIKALYLISDTKESISIDIPFSEWIPDTTTFLLDWQTELIAQKFYQGDLKKTTTTQLSHIPETWGEIILFPSPNLFILFIIIKKHFLGKNL